LKCCNVQNTLKYSKNSPET